MSFLPEDDQDYLRTKGLRFELAVERQPDGTERKGVIFPAFAFQGNLYTRPNGQLLLCKECDLLVLIPNGYRTTRLDSFYTSPRLKRPDGTDPDRAASESMLFNRSWQFWSRHLADSEWRPGVDGIETFLQYVRAELRRA